MARVDRTNDPHHVYRCYDHEGRLLYVGSTTDLFGRLRSHRQKKWWAPNVAKVKATYFPNGVAARAVESRAICEEVPRWNKSGKWAGRHLWTEQDWLDWILVNLRDGDDRPMTWIRPAMTRAITTYTAMYGKELPAHLDREWKQVQAEQAANDERRRKHEQERRAAFNKAEADELAAMRRRKKKGKSA